MIKKYRKNEVELKNLFILLKLFSAYCFLLFIKT